MADKPSDLEADLMPVKAEQEERVEQELREQGHPRKSQPGQSGVPKSKVCA